MVNVNFGDENWKQATLPVTSGGLGFRRTVDVALPANLASIHSTTHLIRRILPSKFHDRLECRIGEAIDTWRIHNPNSDLPEESDRSVQKIWDRTTYHRQYNEMLSASNQLDRARLLAAASKSSGAWLEAIPSAHFGTLLDGESIRIGAALRVGANVCEPHPCRCGETIDPKGLHPLSCRYSAGRAPRHAALNEVIKRALSGAGIPSTLEPHGLNRGDGKRPDGVTLFPWRNGRCLVWDVTCVDTFAEGHLTAGALQVGSAAEAAEEQKRREYAAISESHLFEPIAVETTGVFGPTTLGLLKSIGKKISQESGDPRESTWLRQRVSVAILRGNATSIRTSAQREDG